MNVMKEIILYLTIIGGCQWGVIYPMVLKEMGLSGWFNLFLWPLYFLIVCIIEDAVANDK